jgi:hypothetical protein
MADRRVQLYNRHFGLSEDRAPSNTEALGLIIRTSCKHCGYPPGAHARMKCLTEPTTYEATGWQGKSDT